MRWINKRIYALLVAVKSVSSAKLAGYSSDGRELTLLKVRAERK
jgi:hypothetical protein